MKKTILYPISILIIFSAYVCAEEILPGEYKISYISPGESHSYTFSANKGDVVTILMGDVNEPFPGSSGSGFWPQVELIEPNVTRTLDWGWDFAEINAKIISESGTHMIIARERKGTVAGSYGLSMVKNPGTDVNDPEDEPVSILPGEYKCGYIAEGDLDGYSFYADAGDVVTILMGDINESFPGSSGSGFWPQIELIEPNGTRTRHWGWDSAEINAKIISESGIQLIIAREQKGNMPGLYGLSMVKNPGTEVNDPEDER